MRALAHLVLALPVAVLSGQAPGPGGAQELAERVSRVGELAEGGRDAEARAQLAELRETLLNAPELDAELLARAADLALRLGDTELALEGSRLLLVRIERTDDALVLMGARARHARALALANRIEESLAELEEVCESAERLLSEDDPLLPVFLLDLSKVRRASRDLDGALALQERVLELLARARAADDREVVRARVELAKTLLRMRDAERALPLLEQAIAVLEPALPPSADELLDLRSNHAIALKNLGRLDDALAVEREILRIRREVFGDDHPDVALARLNLGSSYLRLNRIDEAVVELRAGRDYFAPLLPPEHPRMLGIRLNMAIALKRHGDYSGARIEEELVLGVLAATLPADHPELSKVRNNLATTLIELGDYDQARALLEVVAEQRERTLGLEHPGTLDARANLAGVLMALGDREGGLALLEDVLAVKSRQLPPEHPEICALRMNLATALAEDGRPAEALAIQEEILALRERGLGAEDPITLRTREAWAASLSQLGRNEEALPVQEELARLMEARHGPEHVDVLRAWRNLAVSCAELGDVERALELERRALDAFLRLLPPEHERCVELRRNLCWNLARAGRHEELAREAELLLEAVQVRLSDALVRAPREARAVARESESDLSSALAFAELVPALGPRAFELIESARWVAIGVPAPTGPDVDRLRHEVAGLREEVDARVETGAGEQGLAALVLERDRAEVRLRSALGEAASIASLSPEAVAAALPPGSAIVLFRRCRRRSAQDDAHAPQRAEYLAHVLAPGRPLRRVDLGGADRIEEAVAVWRSALGAPLVARGHAPLAADADTSEAARRAAGEHLRALVLDPVLETFEEPPETLFVALDEALHLVPLAALPWKEGCVGDAFAVRVELSLARLVRPVERAEHAPRLVALGGPDYGTAPAASGLERGSTFSPLPGTLEEVDAVAALFAERFDADPLALRGAEATEAALARAAPTARWLHLATHGWFAREERWEPAARLAPLTLCGLALAGANRGRDAVGRAQGRLTAEELAGWDLSGCELAVLSACETSLGARRAGQGVRSLQAALHAAGARSSITSLWKVDDAWTRELMLELYRRLWIEGEPKAEALWGAKRTLRERGAAPRDWAGWVLVGDPE